MNKSEIDWTDMTWNPITGCLQGCEYCYARKITHRFGGNFSIEREGRFLELYGRADNPYPDKFDPTFHRYRLDEPKKVREPQAIFVCSMADLFGEWIPDEWIDGVFKAVADAPWHRYIFLTKNPSRYYLIQDRYEITDRMYFGATVTDATDAHCVSESMGCMKIKNTFLSIEPIQADVAGFIDYCGIDWIIVGQETGNRKGRIVAEREWIADLKAMAASKKVPLFMKRNLSDVWGEQLVREVPW